MAQRDDTSYFEKRIADERRRAQMATNPAVERVHTSMIAEYEARLKGSRGQDFRSNP